MKSSYFSKIVFPFSLLLLGADIASASMSDPDGENSCQNAKGTSGGGPSLTEGCLEYCDGYSGEETCKPVQSIIMSGNMRYFMWAQDFSFDTGSSACSPCGSSSASSSTKLPSLEISRVTSYKQYFRYGSFGARTGLKKYDKTLKLYASNNRLNYNDPGQKEADWHQLSYDASKQAWYPARMIGKGYAGVFLFDVTGNLIVNEADRNNAHTAILSRYDGSSEHYEIGWSANGTGNGRLVSLMDRYGNEEIITYVDAQPLAPTSTVSSPQDFHRKASITDAYGRTATLHTDWVRYWVVSQVDLPNGESLQYDYEKFSLIGNPALKSVIHPNGAETLWNISAHPTNNLTMLDVYEPLAEPQKRRKIIYVQNSTMKDSSGQSYATNNSLTRAVENGSGEFVYANRYGSGDLVYHYNGGNLIDLLEIGNNKGNAQLGYVTNSPNIISNDVFHSDDLSNWIIESKHTQTNSSRIGALSKKDALSKEESVVRDPLTQSVTEHTREDGSITLHSYSNFDQSMLSTDGLGRMTLNTYDALGNLVSFTRGVGSTEESTISNTYNSAGLITENRDALYDPNFPDLHNTQYVYDSNNYLIEKIDAADVTGATRPKTVYAYDSIGRIISITDPEGRTTAFEYDVQNRLVKTTYNDSSFEQTNYGIAGSGKENLVVSRTNRNGIQTTYDYDLADRNIQTTIAPGTPEESLETCTYLTGTNKKQTCTLNGETKEYLFDHRNRIIGTKIQADSQTQLTTTTEYDVLSRRRSTTDAYGRKIYYLYDQNDRIIKTVKETFPAALAAPAISANATQSATQGAYSLTDKDGNTLTTTGTHSVTYTGARDLFLQSLTRSSSNNAAYLITEAVYDAEGQLLIHTDARGFQTWYEYDTLGRNTLTITAVGTAEEIRTETLYDDNSNVIETRSPRYFSENINARDTYSYNGRNLRASHTTAAGSAIAATQSWSYYLDGRSNQHTDFRGNIAKTYWHLCCGRLQASVQRDGTSTAVNNTDYYGNVTHTAVVSNLTNTSSDWHNPADTDTLQETTTRFDGRNRPTFTTQWLTPLGSVNDHARVNLGDATGVPIAGQDSIPSSEGLTTSYEYDEDLTDGTGIDSTYAAQFSALSARHGYNPFGTGANGFAVAVTNPAGETSVQVMDGAGRTLMSINPEGDITTMKYDTLVDGATLTVNPETPLNGTLLATSSTDANGNTNTSYTDAAGRTLANADALGNLSAAAYDNNSNTVVTRDPNGLGTDCTFDALNRDISCADLQEQTEGVDRSKTFNAASQVLTSTNAEGHVTTNLYDERSRLTSSTDPNAITVAYTYDDNNNLTSLTDGNNNTRQWVYDARNLKVQKINPGAGDLLSYSYDALGRLDTKTDQLSDTCSMVYDLAGRMIEKIYKTGGSTIESTDTFSYDAASRLTQTVKGRYNITTTHTYALDSMPLSETINVDNRSYTISRSYDAANRPSSQTFADGHTNTWSYDARNLVTNLSYDGEPVLSQSHDAGYRLSQQILGNGLLRNVSYGRLDNLRTNDITSDGAVISSLDWNYSYNVDKQVTAESTAGSFLDDSSFTASYDAGDRLLSWTRAGSVATGTRQSEAWNYDNAGNHTSVTRDSTTLARSHNADNELTSIDGDATQLEAKGNMTEDAEGNQYTYDLDNRINEIDMDGGDTIDLSYDALGRRVFRKNGSDESAYLWWGDQECSEHESKAGQNVIQNDLWAHPTALNKIIARAVDGDKNDIEWYHKNYLDHVYAVSDDNGNIDEHYRYSAFGEVEIYSPTGAKLASSAIGNPVLWNSRRYDEQTQLYYYKYRHYKADYGRWLGRDPIEEEGGGPNLYAFCGNNPIDWLDLFGLKAFLDCVRCKDDPTGPISCVLTKSDGTVFRFHTNDPQRHLGKTHGPIDINRNKKIDPNEKNLPYNYPRRKPSKDPYGTYGPIPPGDYVVSPRTDAGVFPKGTPSINTKGYKNGTIKAGVNNKGKTNRGYVLIHGCGWSDGCMTTPGKPYQEIIKEMKNGNIPMKLREICCDDGKLPPSAVPTSPDKPKKKPKWKFW